MAQKINSKESENCGNLQTKSRHRRPKHFIGNFFCQFQDSTRQQKTNYMFHFRKKIKENFFLCINLDYNL